MAIKFNRNAGMMTLALWLILTGFGSLVVLAIPPVIMAVLALVAGILILVGR
jgi:hypothetical protein